MALRKGFFIPTTLLVTAALIVVVASVTFLSTLSLRQSGSKQYRQRAFNIAEAGLNKALWYLSTDPVDGGEGINWRVEDFSEDFGGGRYTFTIKDDPGDPDLFIITSTGVYCGTSKVLEALAGETFAGDFVDYALHSDKGIGIDAEADISGDVYADGDVTVESGAQVSDGTVSVTEGHSVTGEGSYVEGATASENPPVIDYEFYADKIAFAAAGGPGVIEGDHTVSNYNLNGQSVYVNGIITIEGTIAGNGEIISSQSIDLRPGANFTGRLRIIAGDKMRVFAAVNFEKGVMLYAEELILIRNNFNNTDSKMAALSPGQLRIGANARAIGIFFGGDIQIGENTILAGNVISGSSGTLVVGPGVRFIYRDFTGSVPDGFAKTIKIYKWIQK